MGRPPLNITRMHINLPPEAIERISAIVDQKGMSKFIRDAIRLQLDQIAPCEEKAGPPFFESDGGHEPRLSVSGRATVFAILRKKRMSLDQMQAAFGFEDPIDFLPACFAEPSAVAQPGRQRYRFRDTGEASRRGVTA